MELVYQNSSGDASVLWIDSAITVSHEATATPTENPIERGAPSTDHVQQNQDSVTLECVVSNKPILVPQSNMDGATGDVSTVDLAGGGKATVLNFSGEFDRVRSVDAELLRLKGESVLLEVLGLPLREYSDMVIASYQVREEASTAFSLSFNLTLKRILIVTTEIVDVPDPEEARGRDEDSRGNVPGDEVPEPRRSFLRNLFP